MGIAAPNINPNTLVGGGQVRVFPEHRVVRFHTATYSQHEREAIAPPEIYAGACRCIDARGLDVMEVAAQCAVPPSMHSIVKSNGQVP
jgi:hypothetical protein